MMPQGPSGPVCTTDPVYPLDMPICPMLVSGWTGWVDGSTLDPKTTVSKAFTISCGVVSQLNPYPTQQATGPAAGPEIATGWFLGRFVGMKVCVGACLDGRATLEWALSNPQHVMGLHV